MGFLSIIERELRIASRRRGTYWLRMGATGLAISVFFWIWVGELVQGLPGSGERLFRLLTYAALAFCLAAGPLFTADAISEEKREGTLGLLFLTDLRGHDLILGKLAGCVLAASYALIAIFPVLAVPVILGGVTQVTVWRSCLALANTLFLSAAAGLLVSTLGRRNRLVMAVTALLLLGLALGSLGLDAWINGYAWRRFAQWSVLSPIVSLLAADPWKWVSSHDPFWLALWTQQGLAWVFLGIASLLLPRVVADHCWSPDWLRRLSQELSSLRSLLVVRPKRAEVISEAAPYAWLAAHGRLPVSLLWFALTAFFAMAAAASFSKVVSIPGIRLGLDLICAFAPASLLKWWMIAESTHRLAEDRRLGTLELLLGAQLGPKEILACQRTILRQRLRPVLLFTIAVSLLFAWLSPTSSKSWEMLEWIGLSSVVLIMDLITIASVGPWLGLSSRREHRAIFATCWQVLIVPWLVFIALLLMFGLHWSRGFSLGPAWLVISALNNLVWWSQAAVGLRLAYKRLVTEGVVNTRDLAPPADRVVEPSNGIAGFLEPEPVEQI